MVDAEQLKDGGKTTVFPEARENGTEPEEVGREKGSDLYEQEETHTGTLTNNDAMFRGANCQASFDLADLGQNSKTCM